MNLENLQYPPRSDLLAHAGNRTIERASFHVADSVLLFREMMQ